MADLLTTKAMAKGVAMAPRKISLVASLVRGRTVADALIILSHTPKRAARPVEKVISSAKANAVNTHGFDEKTLVIKSLEVTAGPRLKRFRPAAMGRALPYQKKSTHILVIVAGTLKPKKAAKVAKPVVAVEAETPVVAAKPKKETK
ncbi:50S ribosomal protein L22 [Pedobacter sp.]|nr:50S ribosomal protein L22 [Candidatus Saccharibacteria bacterium]